jgi:hypothetical protein
MRMTLEPESKEDESTAASPPEPEAKAAAGPSVAARVKAWAEAATALLKALLLMAAIVVVAVVAGSAILRDDPNRRIVVQIDPEADKALRALGSDLDLRQALADALNERIHGVEKIVQVQGLDKVVDLGQADAVSFKPFGLDVSTNDMTRMLREIKGSPAPMAVRIDLMCAPRPCTEAGVREGLLVVNFSGPHGGSRVSYPVPLVNPALRRSLHQAMEHAADRLLDVNEPLVASIFFLNRQDVLPDERPDSLGHAEGSALRSRGAGSETCLTDLVIGFSLIGRGRWSEGIAAEKRAAQASDLTCQIGAWTNIVFGLGWNQLCDPREIARDFAYDEMRQAVDAIPKVDPGMVGDLVYNRIPTARLILEIVDGFRQTGNDQTREAFCNDGATAPEDVRISFAERLPAILKHIQELLPANGQLQDGAHVLLEWSRKMLAVGTPREDAAGRLVVGLEMARTIESYLLTDRYPRLLFSTQGKLAMDMAWAAHDALAIKSPERRAALKAALRAEGPSDDLDAMLGWKIADNLDAARVAFENALATESEGKLLEPSPNLQPLILLGDALLATGDIPGAERAYRRAVGAFIEDGVEATQVLAFAEAVARWAVLRVAGIAGGTAAAADSSWEQAWARLGSGALDVFSFTRPEMDRPALPALIRPIVADALERCAPKASAPAHWQSDQDRLFALVDCLRDSSAHARALRDPRLQSSAAVNSAIEHALTATAR